MVDFHAGRAARAGMVGAMAGALLLALSGCAGLSSALGMGKNSPDEYAVVRHAPLAVPPDIELRPPTPGVPRPQEITPREQARTVLLGQSAGAAAKGASGASARTNPTPGERALLRQAGARDVPINIREVMQDEASAIGLQNRSFTDSLLFWKRPQEQDEALDAEAEAARQRKEKGAAEPAASASGVIIKRKEGGLLGRLF